MGATAVMEDQAAPSSDAASAVAPERESEVDLRPRAAVERIALIAADTSVARSALDRLQARYKTVAPEQAEVIVALGGDGHLLETVHRYLDLRIPLFGMNCGTVGFLLNPFAEERLRERLTEAVGVRLHPLRMRVIPSDGGAPREALAFNEVSLLRETRQAAKIRILVDGVVRLEELISDGVLVSTPAGSTAYNLSVHGPILPLGAGLLALTPISAFRPRRWRGALLPHASCIRFEIHEHEKRPVSAVADFTEVRDVATVEVREDREACQNLLFDPGHDLEERIVKEQFLP